MTEAGMAVRDRGGATRFGTVLIVGVGLIGGSLGRLLREHGAAREVVGLGRDQVRLAEAVAAGVIDRAAQDIDDEIGNADLLILAVPVGAFDSWFDRLAAAMAADAVITDVGSVKGGVVAAAQARLGGLLRRFVPGHPIAGGEQSGFEAARADLFAGHRVVLTPLAGTDGGALETVRALWRMAGSTLVEMSAGEHDRILSLTSHLPHVLAYTLLGLVAGSRDRDQATALAAGGFHDFTRIAASDPTLWRDICLANRDHLIARIDEFMDSLRDIRQGIDNMDSATLEERFATARDQRLAMVDPRPSRVLPRGTSASDG